jgi:hypothetical protein
LSILVFIASFIDGKFFYIRIMHPYLLYIISMIFLISCQNSETGKTPSKIYINDSDDIGKVELNTILLMCDRKFEENGTDTTIYFSDLIQEKIDSLELAYQVVSSRFSTEDGDMLTRLHSHLQHPLDILIILSPFEGKGYDMGRKLVQQMIDTTASKYPLSTIVLVDPPGDCRGEFDEGYLLEELAVINQTALIPEADSMLEDSYVYQKHIWNHLFPLL